MAEIDFMSVLHKSTHRDISSYQRLMEQGRLQLDRFITARNPLEQMNAAIDAMRDGATAGRVMLQL